MNPLQKFIYYLFRKFLNPYFKKYPGAMFPIYLSFEKEIKKAGFSNEEIAIVREIYNSDFMGKTFDKPEN
jgi:hypothetical protein